MGAVEPALLQDLHARLPQLQVKHSIGQDVWIDDYDEYYDSEYGIEYYGSEYYGSESDDDCE